MNNNQSGTTANREIFASGTTANREIFTLKIICGLNFRVKNIRRLMVPQCSMRILIFHTFNFHCSAYGRKYFIGENFPIYGSFKFQPKFSHEVFIRSDANFLAIQYCSVVQGTALYS